MVEEFEIHGQHEHALEHAARVDSLGRWVAIFTAMLAAMGAVISYQNGSSESLALEFKNEAILKKSEASDQWGYYQAKGIKEVILMHSPANSETERQGNASQAKRYAQEKAAIEQQARKLDAESIRSDKASAIAMSPHHHLSQALALVQAAIALAALTVLTRQRWMLVVSGASALLAIGFWVVAWL